MTGKKSIEHDTADEPQKAHTVSVDIQAEEIDVIELQIGGTKIHLPAALEDWTAESANLLAEGRIVAGIREQVTPHERPAYDRLRLTVKQVTALWRAFSEAAGLSKPGE